MLAKFDQGQPKTALRSTVEIGGWGIYMLIISPERSVYRNWNLEIMITQIKNRSLNS